jgi:hypothetical protein
MRIGKTIMLVLLSCSLCLHAQTTLLVKEKAGTTSYSKKILKKTSPNPLPIPHNIISLCR